VSKTYTLTSSLAKYPNEKDDDDDDDDDDDEV